MSIFGGREGEGKPPMRSSFAGDETFGKAVQHSEREALCGFSSGNVKGGFNWFMMECIVKP